MTLERIDLLQDRLNVNQMQAYALIRNGIIKPPVVVRVGRQYRVNADELEKWIESGGAAYPGGWRKGEGNAEAEGGH